MRFLSWLLFAHFWYLTDCSLNESRSEEQDTSARRATGLALHGTTSPRDGPRRPILRLRQFPGSVQTVTATVTLTVTNTVFSTLPSTPTSDSPQPTNPASETPSPPVFVTTTRQGLASPSSAPSSATPTSLAPTSLPALSTQSPNSLSSASSTIPLISGPSSTQVPSDSALPASASTAAASPEASGSANSGAGAADGSSGSAGTGGPRGLTRLVIMCIVITAISSLGMAAGFLLYLSPYMQAARLRRHAKSGSIFVEDYSASARTFDPNPTGALNYQRSLSRKRNRRAHLLRQPPPPQFPTPPPKSLSFQPALWLPQTSAGPGLSRPAN